MRAGVLILLCLPVAWGVIRLTVTHSGSASRLIDEAKSIVSRVNADNRYLVAEFVEIDESLNSPSADHKALSTVSIEIDEEQDVKYEQTVRPNEDFNAAIERLLSTTFYEWGKKRAKSSDDIDWIAKISEISSHFNPHRLDTQPEVEDFFEAGHDAFSFLIFYDPSNSFCQAATLFSALQAASETNSHVAVVNCKEISQLLCEDVTTPSLRAYKQGVLYVTYSGEMLAEEVKNWILTLRQPAVKTMNEELVPQYRSGLIPGFSEQRPTVSLLFVPDKKDPVYRNFRRFAIENHGKYHLGAMVDPGVAKWAHQPAIVTMKPFEKHQMAHVNFEDLSYDGMARYLEDGLHPSVHKIVDANSLLKALSIPRPLIVFFDPSGKKNSTNFELLATEKNVRTTIATFGHVHGLNSFGIFLAKVLQMEKILPSYLYIDLKQNCVTSKYIAKEDQQEILHWLKLRTQENCSTTQEASSCYIRSDNSPSITKSCDLPVEFDLIKALKKHEDRGILLKEISSILIQPMAPPLTHEEL